MAQCALCSHPKRRQIEAALAAGRSRKLVCHQFRLSGDELEVHLRHHALARQRLAAEPPSPAQAASALSQRAGSRALAQQKVAASRHQESHAVSGTTPQARAQGFARQKVAVVAMPDPHAASAMRPTEPAPAFARQSLAADPRGDEACACGWAMLSPYRRLKRAWAEVSEADRQRFVFEVNTAALDA